MSEFAWLVRATHVLAAALLVGGATLAALAPAASTRRASEWLAWGALAALVLTGIGNLGAYGDGLPPPGTFWGRRFLVKLALVATLALVGAWRILTLARGAPPSRAGPAATAVLGAAALVLGAWLAHG